RLDRSLQDPWQHLLGEVGERLFLLVQIGVPGLGVPDLQPGVGPDDDALTLQARVLAQALWDGDTPLFVWLLVGRTGEEDAAVVTHRLGGDRGGPESLGNALELLYRKDVEASLLAFGDHKTLRQLLTVLSRQEQPSLVVQTRVMGAEEHRRHLPCLVKRSALVHRALHCAPPYSTSPHRQLIRTLTIARVARVVAGHRWGAEWRAAGGRAACRDRGKAAYIRGHAPRGVRG